MITSMRECVAYNDLWPWPISSRSFGLGLENHVRSVASAVLDGFFPYLIQIITSMWRCVACDDLWPWPISSRSFDLDFENRVRSVASTVLDGFIPYLVQMITSMRRCVACDDLWPWLISSRSFDLDFENRVRSVTFSVLDRLFPYLPQIITTIRGCVVCLGYNKIIKFKFKRGGGGYPQNAGVLVVLVDSDLNVGCSWFIHWHKVSIGSGNYLVAKREQAITWTNFYQYTWRYVT